MMLSQLFRKMGAFARQRSMVGLVGIQQKRVKQCSPAALISSLDLTQEVTTHFNLTFEFH